MGGASYIYQGQMAVLKNHKRAAPLIREMWEHEKAHLAKFEELLVEYKVSPTLLIPLEGPLEVGRVHAGRRLCPARRVWRHGLHCGRGGSGDETLRPAGHGDGPAQPQSRRGAHTHHSEVQR